MTTVESEKHTARRFDGGPFDDEWRVVETVSASLVVPLPKKWRAHPEVPIWAVYRLEGDEFVFAGTADSIGNCLAIVMSEVSP